MDRESKLDQRRAAHSDIGHHDDANGAAQWRPLAPTRAKIAATGSSRAGWLGPDRLIVLSEWAWVLFAAWHAIQARRHEVTTHLGNSGIMARG